MRVSNLVFKAGAAEGSSRLVVKPGNITVFIGPNNGGKSASLREIAHFFHTGNEQSRIFASISHAPMSNEEVAAKFESLTDPIFPAATPQTVILGTRGTRQEVNRQYVMNELNSGRDRFESYIYSVFMRHFLLNLGGENRLTMIAAGGAQNLREPPHSTIAALFKDDPLRDKVAEIVYDAFGQYLVIDATQMGMLNYAFANIKPSKDVARSFSEEAINFFSECTRIDVASDGTKAFVGIMTEVLAGTHDILVMDEPEAFLHPSLAYLLGREVARNLSNEKQMFVSTHSPNFLMGCMSVGVPVDIVRLTYKSKIATARLLPSNDLKRMMQDPLLKSVGVMNALFYECAIVVEADSDRAFYDEINSRLNIYDKGGIRHATFLNAHNKQEAVHIARVLRNIGIPAPIILDLDWIKEDGKVAARYLAAAGVPQGLRAGLLDTRRQVRASLENTDGDYKTNGGIANLRGGELATALEFFNQMDRYGLFTVRGGELESWLSSLGVDARKDQWLAKMFTRLGSDPSDAGYIRPGIDDVWQFIRNVGDWIALSDRKGMEFVDPAELKAVD